MSVVRVLPYDLLWVQNMITNDDRITAQKTTDAVRYLSTFLLSLKYLAAINVPNGMDKSTGVISATPNSPYFLTVFTIILFFQVNFFLILGFLSLLISLAVFMNRNAIPLLR